MVKELTCISCPIGCSMTVTQENNEITVVGNSCPRGEIYAKKEMTNPTRIVTTTIPVIGGEIPSVSVKTKVDIPKNKITQVLKELQGVKVQAPVELGQIIIENIANTGVEIIATKKVKSN